MKDKDFWIRLLQPLFISGGGTWILVAFKEHLPYPMFVTLVIVVWLVYIVVLLRLTFGDWFNGLSRRLRDYRKNRENKKLTLKWRARYLLLGTLIGRVIEDNGAPTDEHKEEFRELHSWFIDNRTKFLRLWYSFDRVRTEPAHSTYGSTSDLGYRVFRENYEDPFSFFYQPMTISELERILRSWSNGEIRHVLVKLSDLTDEFAQWLNSK